VRLSLRPCALGLAAALFFSAVPVAPQGKQPDRPLEDILRHAAEKEAEYAGAHALYRYRLSVRVQEFSQDGRLLGEFEQTGDVDFDASGRRRLRLTENPYLDLVQLQLARVELDDLDFIPLFIFKPEQLADYDFTFVTAERVDEVDTYLIRVEPRRAARPGERFFEGLIWIDAHKLDVVRAFGRLKPPRTANAFKGLFQRVEVFRQPVGDFLFPIFVRADDVLVTRPDTVRTRLVVRFSNHERVR